MTFAGRQQPERGDPFEIALEQRAWLLIRPRRRWPYDEFDQLLTQLRWFFSFAAGAQDQLLELRGEATVVTRTLGQKGRTWRARKPVWILFTPSRLQGPEPRSAAGESSAASPVSPGSPTSRCRCRGRPRSPPSSPPASPAPPPPAAMSGRSSPSAAATSAESTRRPAQTSIWSRSCWAGPWMTLPYASYREPWHGQSHVRSDGFHSTEQPRCLHFLESATT